MIKLFIITAIIQTNNGKFRQWINPQLKSDKEQCVRIVKFIRKQLNNPTVQCSEVILKLESKGV